MVLIIMGVVGAGKTTVGTLLAQKLCWIFADADDFHPVANIEKMSHGVPLDDSDRAPWLKALHDSILRWNAERQNAVLACSALKHKYRDELRAPGVQFVYLQGTAELIRERLHSRQGHFATDSILKSQFEDLEIPTDAITVNVDKSPQEIVKEIVHKLGALGVYPDATHK
ncbi:MAG TPA: gluconokinase [Terriglobales bacterium]|nr:gluconokinase [Terriglobales bacterium]